MEKKFHDVKTNIINLKYIGFNQANPLFYKLFHFYI